MSGTAVRKLSMASSQPKRERMTAIFVVILMSVVLALVWWDGRSPINVRQVRTIPIETK